MRGQYKVLYPIVDDRELAALDMLTKKYQKMTEPSKLAKAGKKLVDKIPSQIGEIGRNIGATISEQEIYAKAMKIIAEGFQTIEEQTAKHFISEPQLLQSIQSVSGQHISSVEEICLIRCYDIAKVANKNMSTNYFLSVFEGGGTGVLGFVGIPFNLVLSTLIYYRAVQSVAMIFGYDVKNSADELMIASQVFTNAMSIKQTGNNEVSSIITKIMVMTTETTVKQTAKKTWADMIAKGGIPLLLAQMRALAHKSAQAALEKAGKEGLENVLFRAVFEQIGKRLTLETIQKAVPIISIGIGAAFDTAMMNQILQYANTFYQKRFILEKAERVYLLTGEREGIIDFV